MPLSNQPGNPSSFSSSGGGGGSNRNSNVNSANQSSDSNANPNANSGRSPEDDGEAERERENEEPYYLTKKEELWLRRWERAQGIFKEKGVMLRSWRTGEDVAGDCVRVVEGVLREGVRKEAREKEREGGGKM